MEQVVDKNSGTVLFEGPIEQCRDYVINSSNEFAVLKI